MVRIAARLAGEPAGAVCSGTMDTFVMSRGNVFVGGRWQRDERQLTLLVFDKDAI